MVETTAHRMLRLLERQGVLDADASDDLAEEPPILSDITAASVFNMVSTGAHAGLRV